MTVMRVLHCAVFAALAGPLASIAAQTPATDSGAVVSGRVTPVGDTVGIPGVDMELVGSGMRRTTDRRGQFRFDGVPVGSFLLHARAIGYQPWVGHINVQHDRLYERDIALQRLATALAEVRIEGRMVKVPARFQDVYRRGALGFGRFITREDIDRLNPIDVKSLLGTIPTVQVNDRGVTFQRCQSGFSGISAGRPGSWRPGQDAKVQVYIDGLRMTRDNLGPEGDVEHVLRLVTPSAIQAIEVYTGVSRIPGEFMEDACAVIAIWTRSY